MFLHNLLSLHVGRTSDLLLTNRIWHRWCDVSPLVKLCYLGKMMECYSHEYIMKDSVLADWDERLSPCGLDEVSHHVGEACYGLLYLRYCNVFLHSSKVVLMTLHKILPIRILLLLILFWTWAFSIFSSLSGHNSYRYLNGIWLLLHTRNNHLIKILQHEKIEQNEQRKKPYESQQEQRKQNQPINSILGKTIEDFASIKQG